MILPATAGVLVFACALGREEERRWPWILAAGTFLGVAANYKQVAVFDALAVVLMIWLTHRRPLRHVAVLCLGFALPHLVFSAYFASTGAWGDYWYAVAGSLPFYQSLGDERSPLLRFASYVPALLVTSWLVMRRRNGETVDVAYFPPLWLSMALAGATSSTLPFPHYLLQAAPAFALTIVAVPHLAPRVVVQRLGLTVGAGVAIGVVLGQFGGAIVERHQLHPVAYYRNYAEYTYGERGHQEYERFFDGSGESVRDISAAVREDGAGNTMFAWSELPWVFATADLQNPARYYTSFLGELVPAAKPEVLADLEEKPPAYIILSDAAYAPFAELEEWMRGRYVVVREANDWRLYRSRDLAGKLEPAPRSGIVQSP
jgi:hypothetical protein